METPTLVPAPGMEPHLSPFEAPFHPEGGGAPRPLWLITSPEYAMKRLLADGFERIFQLSRVFRDGELSVTHNPEFTMLEFYRAGTDYRGIMADLERLIEAAARALHPRAGRRSSGGAASSTGPSRSSGSPCRRPSPAQAWTSRPAAEDADRLRAAARAARARRRAGGEPFEDAFFRLMLRRVEPRLGVSRPTFLVDWPASMAALSRVKAGDPRWAERFELYAGGLELANGFTELNDAVEQRRACSRSRRCGARWAGPCCPLDEPFLAALARMPDAGGVAVGFDRLLMLLTGAPRSPTSSAGGAPGAAAAASRSPRRKSRSIRRRAPSVGSETGGRASSAASAPPSAIQARPASGPATSSGAPVVQASQVASPWASSRASTSARMRSMAGGSGRAATGGGAGAGGGGTSGAWAQAESASANGRSRFTGGRQQGRGATG